MLSKENLIEPKLKEILNTYDFLSSIKNKLEGLEQKVFLGEVIVPIAGEFNSGKSSLLNTVLEKDILPTDIVPTTAKIYELRFSADREYANLIFKDDTTEEYTDLTATKKLDVSQIKLVRIYSASTAIPKGIVIVDTPGLSSDNTSHENTVVSYVPSADAILLAIDINQGYTKTTLDFLDTVNSLRKKVFIVLTKCDSKSPVEIDKVKNYFVDNHKFAIDMIAVTSSKEKNLSQFVNILKSISSQKSAIILENAEKILNISFKEILEQMYIQLQSADLNTNDLDLKFNAMKMELESIKFDVYKEIEKAKSKLVIAEKTAINAFDKYLFGELNHLIDSAFTKADGLESNFDEVIKKATERGLFDVYKKEIETISKELADAINCIPDKVDIGNLFPISAITMLTETISVLIVDFFAPGGPIGPILARIGIKFLPGLEEGWKKITSPIRSLVTEGIKMVSKKYVKDQITIAINHAIDAFSSEIISYSNKMQSNIEKVINDSFSDKEKTINETLKSLKEEKITRSQNFAGYIEELKNNIIYCENLTKQR